MRNSPTTSRRGFLGGLLGTALVAPVANAEPGVKPLRRDDTLIALLSDLHVGAGADAPDYMAKRLEQCLGKILAMDPLPGRMFILGDLSHMSGRPEDYRLARKLLQPIYDAGIEVTIGMGNHDVRWNFLQAWPEYKGVSPVKDRVVSCVKGKHFDYIMLDTGRDGKLEGEQREWIQAQCAAAKRQLIVMGHHSTWYLGDPTKPRLISSAIFRELIRGPQDKPTKCAGYIHGHDHIWFTETELTWGRPRVVTRVASLPSTGYWGDIGFALLREKPDRAVLSVVQYDYFTSIRNLKPANEAQREEWASYVRANNGVQCTFRLGSYL